MSVLQIVLLSIVGLAVVIALIFGKANGSRQVVSKKDIEKEKE